MSDTIDDIQIDPEDTAMIAFAIVEDALRAGEGDRLRETISALHPADAADVLEQFPADDFRRIMALTPDVFSAEMICELSVDARALALDGLPATAIAEALSELDSDDATDIIEDLEQERYREVLAEVPARDRAALVEAMSFEEETAGRLMQREFVASPEHWTVGDTIDHLRSVDPDTLPEDFFEIYVVDPLFQPVGKVALDKLLRSPRDLRLTEMARDLELIVRPEVDQEDVAYAFNKYHLVQAPVVDEAGRLKGMVTVDDVVEVIQEENSEDLLALAGVSEGGTAKTVAQSVRARAPWLLLNLGTAVLASVVIGLFEGALEQVVALAILLPIVASMGGNAGTQTLAVSIQALTQRDLTRANAGRIILREFMTGIVNGVIFAVVMALVALIWFQNPMLALVIAAAMVINLICAGVSGIVIPLWLDRAGADPAVSSTVFLTTVTDVVGFLAFLGLATLLLL